MKNLIAGVVLIVLVVLVFMAGWKIYNGYVYDNVPDGNDVANAIRIQTEIDNLLSASLDKSDRINTVVMMDERRNGFAVGIKNPNPSIESIFDIISKNKESLTGSDLIITFYDKNMKLLEVRKIVDKL